jgi:hypothetical protein
MPRECSICRHDRRDDINRALLGSASLRDIEGQFRISKSSLDRHRRLHLTPKVANAIARHEDIDAERLKSYAVGLLEHAMFGVLRSRQEEDFAGQRAYLAEARKGVELLARLSGVIGDRAAVQIDARKQVAVLANLSEEDLRALARGDVIDGAARELPEAVTA